jgi:hypothetical protein
MMILFLYIFFPYRVFIDIFFPTIPEPFPRLAPGFDVVFVSMFLAFLLFTRSVRFDYLVGNSCHRLVYFFRPIVSLSIIISAFFTVNHNFFSSPTSSHFRFPVQDVRDIQVCS